MKSALVCGAGGFIGSHLVKKLKQEGFWVKGVDLVNPKFSPTQADTFILGDLRDPKLVEHIVDQRFDEVYQLAADMGGAGFVFVGDYDADIMHNSALINLNIAQACCKHKVRNLLYTSSACIYPQENQLDPNNPYLEESSAYPANPDSEYGWEKLFSERLYLAYMRNYGLNVRIARLHNIFGEEGAWNNGREKAPAAICRKVAQAPNGGKIEIWGDGEQTRSFLHIYECLEAMRKFMNSNFNGPVNIGSEERVSINQLAQMVMDITGKKIELLHVDGPQGVRGRVSDNRLFRQKIGWAPKEPLLNGLKRTYTWIAEQVKHTKG